MVNDKTCKDLIVQLENDIFDAAEDSRDHYAFLKLQERLDDIAQNYQSEETFGEYQYKLYELQALIHYYLGNDDDALICIDDANHLRGSEYKRSNEIRTMILDRYSQSGEDISMNNTPGLVSAVDKNEMNKTPHPAKGIFSVFMVIAVYCGMILVPVFLFMVIGGLVGSGNGETSTNSYREEINTCINNTNQYIYEVENKINDASDAQGGDYDEMDDALYSLDDIDTRWSSCVESDWSDDNDPEVVEAVSCLSEAEDHIFELSEIIHEAADSQAGDYDELDSALSELSGAPSWSGCNSIS